MKVSDIIYHVRESLDEQSGTTDFADGYLDNIIRSKVYDALRWVLLYGDASLLNGSGDAVSGGCVKQEQSASIDADGFITLDGDFVRLIRVKVSGWKKAVMYTIEEDSDEYLMQSDDTAKADNSRPVVALIRTVPNKLQVFPKVASTCDITYIVMPSTVGGSSIADSTDISVPAKLVTAYIYYICYLVMVAYDDVSKAQNMLGVARMNAGVSDGKG